MSQKASRKGVVNDEKEKRTDSPVKEMKKKMAANAEKEKQSAEKKEAEKPAEKTEKNDKPADKVEKVDKKLEKPADKKTDKQAENKIEKQTDKPAEKKNEKQTDKPADKKNEKQTDKPADKKNEKQTDKPTDKKNEKQAEKPNENKVDAPVEKKEDNNKDDKAGKSDKAEPKKAEVKPKQNGTRANGTTNGDDASVDSESEAGDERDEMFPELAYDDTSDTEFEPPTPESLGRSFTRRSQAKTTRTPETPRPASDKQADAFDDSKVLKLKEDVPSTDRKLRSSDSPKPEQKKDPKKSQDSKEESKVKEKENGDKTAKELEVVIEIDGADEGPRKADTNYSRSRVKVSPYRRSGRRADHTASSMLANYTGNNTTMEMDITETSSFISEEPSMDESPYLSGLRSIRGRRSYKPLKEMTLRHVVNKSVTRSLNVSNVSGTEQQPTRPTAPVVGRKRKPEGEDEVEVATEAMEVGGKRARLLERLAGPFRRVSAQSTPLPARRAAEIVGINTDLPLSAPVAATPEVIKEAPVPSASTPVTPISGDKDKRCVVM